MYRLLIRPILFMLEPETAHHLIFNKLKFLFKIPGIKSLAKILWSYEDKSLAVDCLGLKFRNQVGLAAGFDKDAKLFDELGAFGFGFIEIGTLTPVAQPGNPKPRMFRLPADNALINRMGFNNQGVDKAVLRLKNRKPGLIIGGNIGKNKNTPNEEAFSDYEKAFNALYPVVDYFVINISSPNTPGLRALQEREPLTLLLRHISTLNRNQAKPRPLLLKIAPDLGNEQLDEIVEIVQQEKLDGIIATNTTISREGLKTQGEVTRETGGLSGRPLTVMSREVVSYLRKKAGPGLAIIGVGGIFTAADAKAMLDAGANLVQVYTGFIYEGPGMIKRILKGLS